MRSAALFVVLLITGVLTGQAPSFQTTFSFISQPAFGSRTNITCTSDGGFFMPTVSYEESDSYYHLVVVKTLNDGTLQWARRLDSPLRVNVTNRNAYAIETSDAGFAISTLLEPATSGDDPSLIVTKMDNAGNVLWTNSFTGMFLSSATIMEASDGAIIVTGTVVIDTTCSFWVARLTSAGNLIWTRSYFFEAYNEVTSACYSMNGDIIVAGNIGLGGDLGVLKIDGSGNIIWGNIYRGPQDDYLMEIKELSNGEIAFIGRGGNPMPNSGCWDITFARLSSTGQVLWSWFYGGNDCDEGYSFVENSDGTLTLGCEPESFINQSQCALMKTDANGNFIWMKTYNDVDGNFPSSLCKTQDGGYALLGVSGNYTVGGAPLFLNKTDADGFTTCGTMEVIAVRSPYQLIVEGSPYSDTAIQPGSISLLWTSTGAAASDPCINEPDSIIIPNVFTPGNEDGLNDVFQIGYSGNDEFHLWIYDRWGILMFESINKNVHWDGNTRNGNPATAGTYYYVLTLGVFEYTGFLTLIR